jgi:hypothetical protein
MGFNIGFLINWIPPKAASRASLRVPTLECFWDLFIAVVSTEFSGLKQFFRPKLSITGWWLGIFFYVSIQLGRIIPTDELIFFRGVGIYHQPDNYPKQMRIHGKWF